MTMMRKTETQPCRAIFHSSYVFVLTLSGGLSLALTACGGIDEQRWKEQVYLHDGSLIEVDRDATRAANGFPDAQRGRILTEELKYAPLRVVWRNEGAGEQVVSFDITTGIPYLVAVPSVDSHQYCVGKEPGEYIAVYYRWINGKQEKVSRESVPIGIMRWNLTGIDHWGKDSRSDPTYLSWHDVMDMTHQAEPPMLLTDMLAQKSYLHCK